MTIVGTDKDEKICIGGNIGTPNLKKLWKKKY